MAVDYRCIAIVEPALTEPTVTHGETVGKAAAVFCWQANGFSAIQDRTHTCDTRSCGELTEPTHYADAPHTARRCKAVTHRAHATFAAEAKQRVLRVAFE